VGYYRAASGPGTWWVRYRIAGRGAYVKVVLGAADDVLPADGREVLSFSQAVQKGAARAATKRGHGPIGEQVTVRAAIESYFAWLRSSSRSLRATLHAYQTAEARILPALGKRRVAALTTAELRAFQAELLTSPARRGGARTLEREAASEADREEILRRRKVTANRVFGILRAALNFAFQNVDGIPSDAAWRRVRPFRGVERGRVRPLSEDEQRRLLNACEPALRDLVLGALKTGGRFGELATVKVADFNPETRSLVFRRTKSGKSRVVPLDDEGLELCARLAAGQPGERALFRQAGGEPWGKSVYARPLGVAMASAKIAPHPFPPSFHNLRDTYVTTLLRHGMPAAMVATLVGHSDTRLLSTNYSAWMQADLSAAVELHLPRLFPRAPRQVARFKLERGAAK